MESILNQFQNIAAQLKENLPLALFLVAGLWLIWLINWILGYRLNYFGIYPRHLFGLVGIPFHPFIHGSFNHVFFNSVPLFALLTLLLTNGIPNLICTTVSITLLSGFAIWLFGRRALHIGASGLIMGYFGYLLVQAYRHPSASSYVLAAICIYYFGGLLLSIFPKEEAVSWEGHLLGLFAGIVTTSICPGIIQTT